MPLLFPFSFAALWIFAMASFSSSCIVPSRMECPMLFPRSKGPTNSTFIPGTLAIASTCERWQSAQLPALDKHEYLHSPGPLSSLSARLSLGHHLLAADILSGFVLQISPLGMGTQSLDCRLAGIWQTGQASSRPRPSATRVR